MEYKREYCCPKCGLIFSSEYTTCDDIVCPECGNYKKDVGVIAVDSFIYLFSRDEIEQNLMALGKKIHYAKINRINGDCVQAIQLKMI
jgi:hypothetical protein